jgi:nucleotide-binding universal stress UspA family protein
MSLDPVSESLGWMADQEQYDLVVVGSRRRKGLSRFRHDPVSQGVLRVARSAVACVPLLPRAPSQIPLPRIARILAPTDFSEVGNHAIRHAYALLPRGGTVHLLRVVEEASLPNPLYAHYKPGRRPTPEERSAQEKDLEAALRALVPDEAEARGIETRVEIVHGADPAEAIRVAGERLGVDAICMGTHGRSGLSALVAGSVARKVASAASRPLFLVRPGED